MKQVNLYFDLLEARERQRQRQTDRQRQRQTDRDRQRQTDRDRQRQRI